MKFKENITNKVEKKLLSFAKKQNLKPKDVNFIGVHVRRTDHAEFMLTQFNEKPIGKCIFVTAPLFHRAYYI